MNRLEARVFATSEVIDSLNHHGFPRIGSELEIAKPGPQPELGAWKSDAWFGVRGPSAAKWAAARRGAHRGCLCLSILYQVWVVPQALAIMAGLTLATRCMRTVAQCFFVRRDNFGRTCGMFLTKRASLLLALPRTYHLPRLSIEESSKAKLGSGVGLFFRTSTGPTWQANVRGDATMRQPKSCMEETSCRV